MIQPEAAERLWGGQSVRAIMHSSSFRDCQVGDAALGRCSYIIFCREVAWRRSDAGCVFGARGGDDGLARSDSEHMFKWKYGGVGANTRTQKLAEPLQPANVFVCSFLYTHVNTFVFDNSNIKKKQKQFVVEWGAEVELRVLKFSHLLSAGQSFMSAFIFDCFRRGGQRVSPCPPPATRLASCMTPYSLR